METRKVVVRVKKHESVTEKTKSEKQIRYEKRIEERKANKKPTRTEMLASEGMRFVNFVSEIELFNEWVYLCESRGIKPNERFNDLIKMDKDAMK